MQADAEPIGPLGSNAPKVGRSRHAAVFGTRTFLRPDQQRRLSTKRPASHCGDARRNLGDTHATVSFTRLSNQVAGFAWDRPRERNGSLSHEVVGTTR